MNKFPGFHFPGCDCRYYLPDDRCLKVDAEVEDLKARLKAARSVSKAMQERAPSALLDLITDLRRRNWRQP